MAGRIRMNGTSDYAPLALTQLDGIAMPIIGRPAN